MNVYKIEKILEGVERTLPFKFPYAPWHKLLILGIHFPNNKILHRLCYKYLNLNRKYE